MIMIMTVIMIVLMVRTPGRIIVPGGVETAGFEQVFRAHNISGLTPSNRFPRKQHGLREVITHQLQIMHDSDHRAFLAMPAMQKGDQIIDRFGIDGVEGFIEQNKIGILKQHPGEQGALKLATRQGVDGTFLKTLHANRFQRLCDGRAVGSGDAFQQATFGPKAKFDDVENIGREGSVQFCLLRQIGNPAAISMHAGSPHRFQAAHYAFEQGGFARPVGANQRQQTAMLDRAGQSMDRRMGAVAQSEIVKVQTGL